MAKWPLLIGAYGASLRNSAAVYGVGVDHMSLLCWLAASLKLDVRNHTVTACESSGIKPPVAHPGKQSQFFYFFL